MEAGPSSKMQTEQCRSPFSNLSWGCPCARLRAILYMGLLLETTLWRRSWASPHFTGGELEAQVGDVASPWSHKQICSYPAVPRLSRVKLWPGRHTLPAASSLPNFKNEERESKSNAHNPMTAQHDIVTVWEKRCSDGKQAHFMMMLLPSDVIRGMHI